MFKSFQAKTLGSQVQGEDCENVRNFAFMVWPRATNNITGNSRMNNKGQNFPLRLDGAPQGSPGSHECQEAFCKKGVPGRSTQSNGTAARGW